MHTPTNRPKLPPINQPAPPQPMPLTPGSYAKTVCKNCVAGWTRQWQTGPSETSVVVICKLDMEPVRPTLFDCDNFDSRLPTDRTT